MWSTSVGVVTIACVVTIAGVVYYCGCGLLVLACISIVGGCVLHLWVWSRHAGGVSYYCVHVVMLIF